MRPLIESDRVLLDQAIAQDPYHCQSTTSDFFYDTRTDNSLFEDSQGPVAVIRCSKALRIDVQFLLNDRRRNAAALIQGFQELSEQARNSGYTEIVLQIDSPELLQFCTKTLGCSEVNGELRRMI